MSMVLGLLHFREVAAASPARPVLVGPYGFHQADRTADVRWLAQSIGIRLANEGRLRALAARRATGSV